MEKFKFSKAESLNSATKIYLQAQRHADALKVHMLEPLRKQKEKEMLSWFVENYDTKPFSCSCSCHRCAEGMQECGEDVHFIAKPKDESRDFPVSGSSSSRGFSFTMEDGSKIAEEDAWFIFGDTILSLAEYASEE